MFQEYILLTLLDVKTKAQYQKTLIKPRVTENPLTQTKYARSPGT